MREIWFSVFPGNKAPDGDRVEPLFVYGNHDVSNWDSIRKRFASDEEYEKAAIFTHPAEVWKKYMHEEYSPIWMKTVKGYKFVGAHWQVTVHFPSVLKKTHGVRAFDYEVRVEARYIDVVKEDVTKHVYSPKCYLGEEKDGGEVTCVFAETQLPINYKVRFIVRPCECFGGKSDPIYSEWVPARTE